MNYLQITERLTQLKAELGESHLNTGTCDILQMFLFVTECSVSPDLTTGQCFRAAAEQLFEIAARVRGNRAKIDNWRQLHHAAIRHAATRTGQMQCEVCCCAPGDDAERDADEPQAQAPTAPKATPGKGNIAWAWLMTAVGWYLAIFVAVLHWAGPVWSFAFAAAVLVGSLMMMAWKWGSLPGSATGTLDGSLQGEGQA